MPSIKKNQYRSRFEGKVSDQLTGAGVAFEYEKDRINYYLKLRAKCHDCDSTEVYTERWYTPDFFIQTKDKEIILEAKGKFGAPERKKMLAVKELHPDMDIRMVFMRDNKIHRMSKTRYTEWCEKHGITCCVAPMPDEWIKEFKDGN